MGVYLRDFRDHILCTVLVTMLAGVVPPCWEEDWKVRPQNLAEWWRLNYDLVLVMARTFNGSGGLNVHESQIPGGFPTRWKERLHCDGVPQAQGPLGQGQTSDAAPRPLQGRGVARR